MKKKIMFFLYSLAGGGAERTVINIINNLDKDKFDILLVLGTNKNNDYKHLLSHEIRIHFLNSKKLRFSIFKLVSCINKEKPDLMFSTLNPNNIILLLAKIISFKRIPAVVREANNRTQSGSVSIVNKNATRLLYNFVSNKVIALSNGVKEDLVNNFNINEEKINVIHNPVEIENIKLLKDELVTDFHKEKNEKLIIAVGRLVHQKDYHTLIRAFAIITKKVKSRLLILGKGALELELKKEVKSLGLEDKVTFLGFKKNPYKYMKKSDVFILSSKWEGFGHVVVEAMATGTPVISTNCKSGPNEIIKDNDYGILVPVGDYELLASKAIELLRDEVTRMKYIKKGHIRAFDFNAREIVKHYENVFEETVLKNK